MTTPRSLAPVLTLAAAAVVAVGVTGVVHASDDKAPSAADQVSGLSWMSGRWKSESPGSYWEETWSSSREGNLIGMARWQRGGKIALYEFMSVEITDGVPEMRLRHFGAGLEPWEEGGAMVMKLVRTGEREAAFENPERDFPQRIVYSRPEDGRLIARLEGMGADAEKEQVFRFELMD